MNDNDGKNLTTLPKRARFLPRMTPHVPSEQKENPRFAAVVAKYRNRLTKRGIFPSEVYAINVEIDAEVRKEKIISGKISHQKFKAEVTQYLQSNTSGIKFPDSFLPKVSKLKDKPIDIDQWIELDADWRDAVVEEAKQGPAQRDYLFREVCSDIHRVLSRMKQVEKNPLPKRKPTVGGTLLELKQFNVYEEDIASQADYLAPKVATLNQVSRIFTEETAQETLRSLLSGDKQLICKFFTAYDSIDLRDEKTRQGLDILIQSQPPENQLIIEKALLHSNYPWENPDQVRKRFYRIAPLNFIKDLCDKLNGDFNLSIPCRMIEENLEIFIKYSLSLYSYLTLDGFQSLIEVLDFLCYRSKSKGPRLINIEHARLILVVNFKNLPDSSLEQVCHFLFIPSDNEDYELPISVDFIEELCGKGLDNLLKLHVILHNFLFKYPHLYQKGTPLYHFLIILSELTSSKDLGIQSIKTIIEKIISISDEKFGQNTHSTLEVRREEAKASLEEKETQSEIKAIYPFEKALPPLIHLSNCLLNLMVCEKSLEARKRLEQESIELTPFNFIFPITQWRREICFYFLFSIFDVPQVTLGPLALYCKTKLATLFGDFISPFGGLPEFLFAHLEPFNPFLNKEEFFNWVSQGYVADLFLDLGVISRTEFVFNENVFKSFQEQNRRKIMGIIYQLEQIGSKPRVSKRIGAFPKNISKEIQIGSKPRVSKRIGAFPKNISKEIQKISSLFEELMHLPNGMEIFFNHLELFDNNRKADPFEINIYDMFLSLYFPFFLDRYHNIYKGPYLVDGQQNFGYFAGIIDLIQETHPDINQINIDQRRASLFWGLIGYTRAIYFYEKRKNSLYDDLAQFVVEYFTRRNDTADLEALLCIAKWVFRPEGRFSYYEEDYELCLVTRNGKLKEGQLFIEKVVGNPKNSLRYTVFNPQEQKVTGIITQEQLKEEISDPFIIEKLEPLLLKILEITSGRGHTNKLPNNTKSLVIVKPYSHETFFFHYLLNNQVFVNFLLSNRDVLNEFLSYKNRLSISWKNSLLEKTIFEDKQSHFKLTDSKSSSTRINSAFRNEASSSNLSSSFSLPSTSTNPSEFSFLSVSNSTSSSSSNFSSSSNILISRSSISEISESEIKNSGLICRDTLWMIEHLLENIRKSPPANSLAKEKICYQFIQIVNENLHFCGYLLDLFKIENIYQVFINNSFSHTPETVHETKKTISDSSDKNDILESKVPHSPLQALQIVMQGIYKENLTISFGSLMLRTILEIFIDNIIDDEQMLYTISKWLIQEGYHSEFLKTGEYLQFANDKLKHSQVIYQKNRNYQKLINGLSRDFLLRKPIDPDFGITTFFALTNPEFNFTDIFLEVAQQPNLTPEIFIDFLRRIFESFKNIQVLLENQNDYETPIIEQMVVLQNQITDIFIRIFIGIEISENQAEWDKDKFLLSRLQITSLTTFLALSFGRDFKELILKFYQEIIDQPQNFNFFYQLTDKFLTYNRKIYFPIFLSTFSNLFSHFFRTRTQLFNLEKLIINFFSTYYSSYHSKSTNNSLQDLTKIMNMNYLDFVYHLLPRITKIDHSEKNILMAGNLIDPIWKFFESQFDNDHKDDKYGSRSRRNIPLSDCKEHMVFAFLRDAIIYSLEYFNIAGNEFCGLLESRAAIVAVKYFSMLREDELKGAGSILAILANLKNKRRSANEILESLVEDIKFVHQRIGGSERFLEQLTIYLIFQYPNDYSTIEDTLISIKDNRNSNSKSKIDMTQVTWTAPPLRRLPSEKMLLEHLSESKEVKTESRELKSYANPLIDLLRDLPVRMDHDYQRRSSVQRRLHGIKVDSGVGSKIGYQPISKPIIEGYESTLYHLDFEVIDQIVDLFLEIFSKRDPIYHWPFRGSIPDFTQFSPIDYLLQKAYDSAGIQTGVNDSHHMAYWIVIILRMESEYRCSYSKSKPKWRIEIETKAWVFISEYTAVFLNDEKNAASGLALPEQEQYFNWYKHFWNLVLLVKTLEPDFSLNKDNPVNSIYEILKSKFATIKMNFEPLHEFLTFYDIISHSFIAPPEGFLISKRFLEFVINHQPYAEQEMTSEALSFEDEIQLNQNLFGIVFTHNNAFLGYCFAIHWRTLLVKHEYCKHGGVKLLEAFNRHIDRLKEYHLPKLIFHGICAEFNLKIRDTANKVEIKSRESLLTPLSPSFEEIHISLIKDFLNAEFLRPSTSFIQQINRIKELEIKSLEGDANYWICYFVSIFEILLPISHDYFAQLKIALGKSDIEEQNSFIRHWTFILIDCSPEEFKLELNIILKSRFLGQITDQTTAFNDLKPIEQNRLTDEKSLPISTCIQIFKQTEKLQGELDWKNSSLTMLPSSQNCPLKTALNVLAIFPKNEEAPRFLAGQLFYLLGIERRPSRVAELLQAADSKELTKKFIQLCSSRSQNSFQKNPPTENIAEIFFAYLKSINLLYDEDINELERLFDNVNPKDKGIAYTWMAQILVNSNSENLTQPQQRPIIQLYADAHKFIEPAERIILTQYLEVSTDNIKHFIMLTKSQSNSLTEDKNTIPFRNTDLILELVNLKAIINLIDILDQKDSGLLAKTRGELLIACAAAFNFRDEEGFGTHLALKKWMTTTDAVINHFPEIKGFKKPDGNPIFNIWIEIVRKIYSLRTSNPSDIIKYVKSADFIEDFVRLLKFEKRNPYTKTTAFLSALNRNYAIINDVDCQRQLYVAARIFWRHHPWQSEENNRVTFLVEGIINLKEPLLIDTVKEDESDLIKELADKFSYEAERLLLIQLASERSVLFDSKREQKSPVVDNQDNLVDRLMDYLEDNLGGGQTDLRIKFASKSEKDFETLLDLMMKALRLVKPDDKCWVLSIHLLEKFVTYDKRDPRTFGVLFDRFSVLLEQTAKQHQSHAYKALFVNFLVLLQDKFFDQSFDSHLREEHRFFKHQIAELANAIADYSRGYTDKGCKDAIIAIKSILNRVNANSEIPSGRKTILLGKLQEELHRIQGGQIEPSKCYHIIEELQIELNRSLYRAELNKKQPIFNGILTSLSYAGIRGDELSRPQDWDKVLDPKNSIKLKRFQEELRRWEKIPPLLSIQINDQKHSDNFTFPTQSSDLKLGTDEENTIAEFRNLFCKNDQFFSYLFDPSLMGKENAEGQIAGRFLRYYLTYGNQIYISGKADELINAIEKNIDINDYLLEKVFQLIFYVLNPDHANNEDQPTIKRLNLTLIEFMFLHWNKLIRNKINTTQNLTELNKFREMLLLRIARCEAIFNVDNNPNLYDIYTQELKDDKSINLNDFPNRPIVFKRSTGNRFEILGFSGGKWQVSDIKSRSFNDLHFIETEIKLSANTSRLLLNEIDEQGLHFHTQGIQGSMLEFSMLTRMGGDLDARKLTNTTRLLRAKSHVKQPYPEIKKSKDLVELKESQWAAFRLKSQTLGALLDNQPPGDFQEALEIVLASRVGATDDIKIDNADYSIAELLHSLVKQPTFGIDCLGGPEPLMEYCQSAVANASKRNVRNLVAKIIEIFPKLSQPYDIQSSRVVLCLLRGMFREISASTLEIKQILQMNFPEFERLAKWLDQVTWLLNQIQPSSMNNSIDEIKALNIDRDFEPWGKYCEVFDAIRNRHLALLPSQGSKLEQRLRSEAPSDFQTSELLGLVSFCIKHKKIQVTKAKLKFNLQINLTDISDLIYAQIPESNYIPLREHLNLLAEDASKVIAILSKPELNTVLLRELAVASPNNILDYVWNQISHPTQVHPRDWLLGACSVLTGIIANIPDNTILQSQAAEFRRKIDEAFPPDQEFTDSSNFTQDQVNCLRDFLIIFKNKFQDNENCFKLYQQILAWAFKSWSVYKKPQNVHLFKQVCEFAKFLPLTPSQLRWTEHLGDSYPDAKHDLINLLNLADPPFTRNTLIEDYLVDRAKNSVGPIQPFNIIELIEFHIAASSELDLGSARLRFFEDKTIFNDIDMFSATALIGGVLRKLGFNPKKKMVSFNDMAMRGQLQTQLINYLSGLLPKLEMEEKTDSQPEYHAMSKRRARLQKFIDLLGGRQILLLGREPGMSDKQLVVDRKCILLIQRKDGYYLAVYKPKSKKSDGSSSEQYDEWYVGQGLNLPDELSQHDLDKNAILRGQILEYVCSVCGDYTLGPREMWPVKEGEESNLVKLTFAPDDIPRLSQGIDVALTEVIPGYTVLRVPQFYPEGYDLCLMSEQEMDKDTLIEPGKIYIRKFNNSLEYAVYCYDDKQVKRNFIMGHELPKLPALLEAEEFDEAKVKECRCFLSEILKITSKKGYTRPYETREDKVGDAIIGKKLSCPNGRSIKKNTIVITDNNEAYIVNEYAKLETESKGGVQVIQLTSRHDLPLSADKAQPSPQSVSNLITEVTQATDRTYLPNFSILPAVAESKKEQLIRLSDDEKRWHSSLFPMALAHYVQARLLILRAKALEAAHQALTELREGNWLLPLQAAMVVQALRWFLEQCYEIMNSDFEWDEKFAKMMEMLQRLLGVRLVQYAKSMALIEGSDYEALIGYFDKSISKLSEIMLSPALVLPPRADDSEINSFIDNGVLRRVCGDSTAELNPENFRQHFLGALQLLSQIFVPTADGLNAPKVLYPNSKDPGLIFVSKSPNGKIETGEQHQGNYILEISAPDRPSFAYVGQKSHDDLRMEYINLHNVDEKDNLCKVFSLPQDSESAGFIQALIEPTLNSVPDLRNKNREIKSGELNLIGYDLYYINQLKAETGQNFQGNAIILSNNNQAIVVYNGRPVLDSKGSRRVFNIIDRRGLKTVDSDEPVKAKLPKDSKAPVYKVMDAILTLAKLGLVIWKDLDNAKFFIEPPMASPAQETKLIPKNARNLQLTWVREMPTEGELNTYNNRYLVHVPGAYKKLRIKGQRWPLVDSVFLSNFYYVDVKGVLLGANIPLKAAKLFNKKLRSKSNQLLLTADEIKPIFTELADHCGDETVGQTVGHIFALNDNLLKFLQGGNRPFGVIARITEVRDLNQEQPPIEPEIEALETKGIPVSTRTLVTENGDDEKQHLAINNFFDPPLMDGDEKYGPLQVSRRKSNIFSFLETPPGTPRSRGSQQNSPSPTSPTNMSAFFTRDGSSPKTPPAEKKENENGNPNPEEVDIGETLENLLGRL